MKNNKIFILIFILSNTFSAYAQVVKSNNSLLYNWNDDPGDLKYTYYEDLKTGNYVNHGKYTFNLVQGNHYKEYANGNFKNGKRDGAWEYRITRLDDLAFDVNWTGTIQLTFSYKDGKPNGLWFYENKQKYRTLSRGVWLPYEYYFAPNETLSVNFSNGHPAGVYNYSNNNINNKSKITGQFNANGLINGTWVLNTSDEKQEYIFTNGVLIKKIIRSMPNGDITNSYTRSEEELSLINYFLTGMLKKEDVKKYRIQIDTVSASEYISFDSRKEIYSKFFNWERIGGDELYLSKRGSDLGGLAISIEFKPQLDLEKINEFNEMKNVYTKYNYSKSYDTSSLNQDFNNFIEKYAISLTDDDYNKVLKYKKDFTSIIIKRTDSVAVERRRQYLLSEFPFLSKVKLTNERDPIYIEFEKRMGLYNQFKIRSEYNVEYKKAKPEVDSVWNENVLSVYCDSNRAVKINEVSKLNFEDNYPDLHPQVQPIIKAILVSQYLPALDSLKNKKDFCEANKLVEKFQILFKKVLIWDKNVTRDLSKKHYYRATNVYAPLVENKEYKTPVFTKIDNLNNMEELVSLLMSLDPNEY